MKPVEITDWHEVPLNEPLEVPAYGPRSRTATFEVNSTADVNVFAAYGADREQTLVAALPRGRSTLELLIKTDAVMWFQSTMKGQRVFTTQKARAQALKPYDGEKFTTMEPRRSGNEEFERMVMIMQQNEKRREAEWRRERERLEAKIEASSAVVEPEPQPSPEPEPEPAPDPDQSGASDA